MSWPSSRLGSPLTGTGANEESPAIQSRRSTSPSPPHRCSRFFSVYHVLELTLLYRFSLMFIFDCMMLELAVYI